MGINEFENQLKEKGLSDEEVRIIINRLKGDMSDGVESYNAIVKRYADGIYPNTEKFVRELLQIPLPSRDIELPEDDRTMSAFSEDLGQYYSFREILFYHLETKTIVKIGLMQIDEKDDRPILGLVDVMPEDFITTTEKDISFYKIRKSKDGEDRIVHTSMSPTTAKIVMPSSQFKDKLPFIKRFLPTQIPYLRSGKIMLPSKGYDHAFLSFVPYNAPEIDPSMELDEAKRIIDYVYNEFAFSDKEKDKVNAIAHLLTPFCRGLFGRETMRTPLFVYMANRERAGKDYCANIVSLVYTGENPEYPPVSKKDANDEEFRKKIFTAFKQGRNIIHSSNNKGNLDSAELEALITKEYFVDRQLGTNLEIQFPNTLTLSISANTGLTYTPDLQYRSIFINLFLAEEDPNKRQFQNPDLHGWIREHRSEILSAIYALVRNWYEKGMPRCTKAFASFPEWMAVVGGIMEATGLGTPEQNDVLNNIGGNKEEIVMRKLYSFCHNNFGEAWITKKQIIVKLMGIDEDVRLSDIQSWNPPEEVNDIIEFIGFDKPNSRSGQTKLGLLLAKYAGRILNDIQLESDEKENASNTRYKFRHLTVNLVNDVNLHKPVNIADKKDTQNIGGIERSLSSRGSQSNNGTFQNLQLHPLSKLDQNEENRDLRPLENGVNAVIPEKAGVEDVGIVGYPKPVNIADKKDTQNIGEPENPTNHTNHTSDATDEVFDIQTIANKIMKDAMDRVVESEEPNDIHKS